MRQIRLWLVSLVLIASCLVASCASLDGDDSPDPREAVGVIPGGKADGSGYSQCELEAVVDWLNGGASLDALAEAGVHSRAASNIVAHRDGPDGVFGTEDDALFGDIHDVDAVFFVGPVAIRQLVAAVDGRCAPSEETAASAEVIFTAPFCDVCTREDRDLLLERSAIEARIVEMIDGATRSVEVAQFTFSRRGIEDALVRAHQRGIAVRVAMDAGQDRSGSLARRLLDTHGLDVRFIRGRQSGGRFGLVHTKFVLVDGERLATGSNNFSSTGVSINEENTLVLTAEAFPAVVAGFACHFERIWEEDHDGAGLCSNDRVAFTPGGGARLLVRDGLREAERSIDVLMHHLIFDALLDELIAAAERGVRVRVIVNEADRGAHTTGTRWQRYFAAGGQMRFKRGNEATFQLMHHKLAIVDDAVLLNGSGNWSGSAFFNNFENFIRWEEPAIVEPFVGLYARLWRWSLSGESLDSGLSAAEQDTESTRVYFGNLHAHFPAGEIPDLLDDGEPHVLGEDGEHLEIEVGETVTDAARYAFEYARDAGAMDFLALTPHCSDERETDATNMPSMTDAGYRELVAAAHSVSEESEGHFLAIAGMEWSTNSTGNHVNVLGSGRIANMERGAFDQLYGEYLPEREAAGERPILMLNHPRTFPMHDALVGNWDQIFGVSLTDIPNNGERRAKFNDYGLDDYPPMSEVRQSWINGDALPDPAIVDATLGNLWAASERWVSLMEVTVARGTELGGESGVNPSLNFDPETGEAIRYTKVHTDFDYYLSRGFRLAPTASHDNHMANWGTGHTSRTAIFAESLDEASLLGALRDRAVYASEDENLELRFYIDGRVRQGEEMETRASSVEAQLLLHDPDYVGVFEVRVWAGPIGGEITEQDRFEVAGGWTHFELPLVAGAQVVYLEVLEPGPNRMAWSAPIWIDRAAL